MAEISGPRSEGISDLGPGSQEQQYQGPVKFSPPAKVAAPPEIPEIGAPEEDEKRNLDEMA